MSRSIQAAAWLAALVSTFGLGCSRIEGDPTSYSAPSATPDSDSSPSVDSSVPIDSSMPILDTGSSSDSLLSADSACAASHVEAEPLPLDLYLMVDRSASMETDSRWDSQQYALKAFFSDPQSQGLFVALRFFPLDDSCNPQDPQCSGNRYVQPLVDWGQLPAQVSVLEQTLRQTSPDGCFTPTQEALNGVLQGAFERQQAQPQHVVSAVLVSDGQPCCNNCPIETAMPLGQIAASYARGNPPVKTFAIYVADEASSVMTEIARQGGTDQAFNATSGQHAFVFALNQIRKRMLGCEFKMPTSDAGLIDPDLIEVQYAPGDGSAVQLLSRVDASAACDSDGGWYYDNNLNPSKLTMCPSTCTMLQADSQGKLDILVLCSSVPR